MSYTIVRDDSPKPEDVKVLSNGLASHRKDLVGDTWFKNISYFVHDDSGAIAGGVYGNCGSFGWAYVDTLWVAEELRGDGFGTELMDRFENEARGHGCRQVFLSTFSFQAPEFYKKRGYQIFGELNDFPEGQSRIFFRKALS